MGVYTPFSAGGLSRAFLISLTVGFTTVLAAACSPTVVVDEGNGSEKGGIGEGADDGSHSDDGSDDGSGDGSGNGSGDAPDDGFTLQCGGVSGGTCSSVEYPEGETCEQCFCRCCTYDYYEVDGCDGDAVCMAYVECVITCDGDSSCVAACPLDPACPTGAEPACYLADCHNWVCSHACGGTG